MNLRDLQYVLLVAEHKHFGRAAEAAHVSQPTLSSQIKKLEDELGVVLFERDSRNVALTAAGSAIVAEAAQVMAHVNGIRDVAQVYNDPLGGEIRLGVIASLAPFLMPELLERVSLAAPRLDVMVHEGLTDTLLVRLMNRELDAVLMASEVEHEGLQDVVLFDEPFWVACGPEHALAELPRVPMEAIGKDSLLLLDEGHCLRAQALDVCMVESVDARVKASSLQTLIRMVARGRGVTLLPHLATRQDTGVVLRPLAGAPVYRTVRLVTRKTYLRVEAMEVIQNAAQAEARAAGLTVV
jgi:LysR family transcriptional regulator, hydrogen peroxide-inducible genes activator